VLDIRAQQVDWRAGVAYARTIEGVDTSRLVLWGSSFGGGHALHLAAEDHAVAAVIAQVPHISGPASAFTRSPRLVVRLIAAGVRDQIGAIAGRQPYRVAAVGYPGDVAMMTSPDAAPMAARLAGDRYEELLPENDVAARITAPTLVQIAVRDSVTPYDVALRAARRIATGEIRTYDCQHFEPYLEPYFDTIVADQIAFLGAHVPTDTLPG
jgi:pimeloyl-ACP methyl ester carboxylesterase